MSLVKAKDSKPELIVRRLTHALGYRYRLHVRRLPGTPDLVFPGRKKVIFVHGCFWHRHRGCDKTRTPKSRVEFWERKFAENKKRDCRNKTQLTKMGWRYLVIWECETNDIENVRDKVINFLEDRE